MDKFKLRETGRDSKSIWKLYNSRKKNTDKEKSIYCFFEGDDDPKYYNFRIENIVKKEIQYFICNGKKGVLDTLKDFELKKDIVNNTIFFIDKDYDDFLNISYNYSNLYITSCYSIENYFTDIEVFKKILKIEFKINEDYEEYIQYINLYKEFQEEFHEYLLEINSFILLYQYLKKENNYKDNINYQNININRLLKIDFTNKQINFNNDIERFNLLTQKRENNEINTLFNKLKDELKENPQCNFRGKFEIIFLYKFITLLQENLNKDKTNKINNISFNLNEKNIISNLSQYSLTDDNLKFFLNKYIKI